MKTEADRESRPDPDAEVRAWRAARLRSAGFDEATAGCLARDREVDVHALLELVDRGCPPHLATRILAPLERQCEGS